MPVSYNGITTHCQCVEAGPIPATGSMFLSSNGLGRKVLILVIRVQIPLGTPTGDSHTINAKAKWGIER